jgi:hypothetical protein
MCEELFGISPAAAHFGVIKEMKSKRESATVGPTCQCGVHGLKQVCNVSQAGATKI